MMSTKYFFPFTLMIVISSFFTACGGGGGGSSAVFTSEDTASLTENHVHILTAHTTYDANVTYSVTGGEDDSLFVIDAVSGQLRFKTSPDFEHPGDSNQDNNYTLTVTASHLSDPQIHQDITVTITDLDEASSLDSDGDYIPDNIEILIQSDPNDPDANNNTIDDGLDTQGTWGDTFFDKQWHIRSLGTHTNESAISTIIGNDLDLLALYHTYMGYNYGDPIIVQIVDTGVDADHEDLSDNMDLSRSYNKGNIGDPSGSGTHGTEVAGIMAARAFNGKGVRGIIPFAKIAGSNWLSAQSTSTLEKVWLTGEGADKITVSNNSWGSYFDKDTLYEDIMEQGVSTLRSGKGRIYVFAAGNDRGNKGNANLQYVLNNRYMIAVAALKHDNTHASYSTPGSNILVSGYSGNYYTDSPTIGTTTIMGASQNTGTVNTQTTWTEDTEKNYTFIMNGTSAASPTVAASIALVLEACPNLTWRDIKYLSATEAKQVDISNPSWVTNHAGLTHSIDYGFGLINAQGMIDTCTTTYVNLLDEQVKSVTHTFNTSVPDDNTTSTFTLSMPDDISIEWVEVTIDNNSTYASDYHVSLVSPEGTETTLMTEDTQVPGDWMNHGFRLSTAALLNERSIGDWQINIRDALPDDKGTVKDIALKIYGH